MYRRYYSYNNMPVRKDNCKVQAECCEEEVTEEIVHNNVNNCENKGGFDSLIQNGKILGRFELDDVLLFVVILVLLFDECEDNLLLLALGFVFISGIL